MDWAAGTETASVGFTARGLGLGVTLADPTGDGTNEGGVEGSGLMRYEGTEDLEVAAILDWAPEVKLSGEGERWMV